MFDILPFLPEVANDTRGRPIVYQCIGGSVSRPSSWLLLCGRVLAKYFVTVYIFRLLQWHLFCVHFTPNKLPSVSKQRRYKAASSPAPRQARPMEREVGEPAPTARYTAPLTAPAPRHTGTDGLLDHTTALLSISVSMNLVVVLFCWVLRYGCRLLHDTTSSHPPHRYVTCSRNCFLFCPWYIHCENATNPLDISLEIRQKFEYCMPRSKSS